MTATGREAALQRFAGQAAVRVVWLPYDYPFAVKRFLDTFQPAIGLIMETEIWPNLMQACSARRLPVLLVNARLSERSARRYRWLRQLLRPAMQAFSAVSAQSAADAERLQALGAPEVEVGGNLKFEMPEHPLAAPIAARLRQHIGARSVLLAASTREGEEALILDAMLQVMAKSVADRSLPCALPLLVIVPRHPTRFDSVEALLRARGLRWQRRSADHALPEDCQVLLGDSMGEMAAYFRACDLAFIGGSLLPFGGQNLIEACAAGVPVLLGPHTYNFSQVSEQALQDGAARRVDDAGDLWQQALQLLQDPVQRQHMGQAGIRFCAAHQGASGRLMRLIARYLPLS
jgi:3-deoxy-D-manno-octulosonic-acid transferase